MLMIFDKPPELQDEGSPERGTHAPGDMNTDLR